MALGARTDLPADSIGDGRACKIRCSFDLALVSSSIRWSGGGADDIVLWTGGLRHWRPKVKFARFASRDPKAPATDRGERLYVIGDVHGCLDLLRRLLARVEGHMNELPPAGSTHVVLLGDLIDRGPDSAGVLNFLYSVQQRSERLIILRGNHEELMLQALDGDTEMFTAWMRIGGIETLRSFGLEPPASVDERAKVIDALVSKLPAGMLEWLRALPLTARSGDYLFCHAGVRPGVAIKRQARADLLWIRREFLGSEIDHGAIVVHGHSIADEVDFRSNRIGIDTGAYRTGVLTALYLEDGYREVISLDSGSTRCSYGTDAR